MLNKLCYILLTLLIFVSSVFCQVTKICGVVKSKNTQECIPFASVTFINSNIGTISDFNGEFVLETKSATDSLLFSSIGYKKKVYPVKKEVFQSLTVELKPENYTIAEVVITPGANPAHALLEKAIKHKSIHHPKNIDSYQCEIYNKIQIDINNVDEKFRDRKVFNQFQFIFEHIDTSSLSGKPYLPVLLTETISDYYYSGENDVEHEVIKANKISGTENKSLSEFTGKMYQKFEIYDNFITVFEPGFVSPIADFGLMYYKYYLVDSLNHQGHWCYKISFEPKRKNERTFSGYFMIADTSYAVVKAQLRISEGANINFINDYMATLAFNEFSDSTWFLTKEKHIVDFNLTDKSLGFFGRKSTSYNNIMMNRPIPEKILKSKTDITLVHNVIDREKAFWEEHRHEALTEKEENIYEMVDSIKNVPVFNTFEDIMFLLTNYYYILGPFEYGPYYKTYSNNYIEGHRVRLGGRTSNAFSTRLMLNGHVAYGFKDEKFKYGFGALYMFSKNPRISAGFQYLNDCKQLGQSDNAFSEDNFLTSLLRRSPNKTLTMVEEQRWFIEREWFQGFSNKLTFRHENIHPVEAIPFQTMNNDNEPTELAYISNSELSLNTRFAKDEKFISGEFTRISLGTKSPIFELNLSVGSKHILKGDFDYLKIQASIKDKVEINPFGYLRYSIDAGKFFGTLPFPLLELHQGNETYAHDHLSFNMMNYYEFVSDRYVSLWTEHHFQGFFLNHIPLIRKLHWREVISARGVMGALNDKHQHILHFPNGLSSLSKPYYEAGFGIENILKLFRIDALWRLTYLDNPHIEPFGIRLKIQVIL